MKRLILIIAIILTSLSFAQMNGKWVIDGQFRTWTDSLQYTANDSDAVKDSVWVINFGFNPDAVRIYVKGNANNTVDSINVRLSAKVYNESGTLVETLWSNPVSLKDSAWNTVNLIVNKSTGKDYSIYQFSTFDSIKISLLNATSTIRERKVQITVQAWKND